MLFAVLIVIFFLISYQSLKGANSVIESFQHIRGSGKPLIGPKGREILAKPAGLKFEQREKDKTRAGIVSAPFSRPNGLG
jgi:hypothetical protein